MMVPAEAGIACLDGTELDGVFDGGEELRIDVGPRYAERGDDACECRRVAAAVHLCAVLCCAVLCCAVLCCAVLPGSYVPGRLFFDAPAETIACSVRLVLCTPRALVLSRVTAACTLSQWEELFRCCRARSRNFGHVCT